jgi:hypothetical protein
MVELVLLKPHIGQPLAGHEPGCNAGDWNTDRLCDKGDGTAGARVDFDNENLIILDGAPSLMANWTFIRPTTPSALASASLCCLS